MSLPAGRTEVNQGTLTIKNLSPADSSLYDCIATNIMGTKKARINVAVQRKPGLLYLFGLGRWQTPLSATITNKRSLIPKSQRSFSSIILNLNGISRHFSPEP